jgi:uncharacterized protein (TIGR02246 family)
MATRISALGGVFRKIHERRKKVRCSNARRYATRRKNVTDKKSATTVRAEGEHAVREVLRDVYTAWAENDADAFAELYVEDATVVMPGTYHKNRDEVQAYMAAAFAGPLKGSRAFDEPQDIRFLSDDVAVVTGEGGILMAGENEFPDERLVRATWVLSRRDRKWLVAAYHNCPAN